MSGFQGKVSKGVVALALLTCGCDQRASTADPGAERSQAEVFCEAECARAVQCAPGGSVASCEAYCVPNRQSLSDLRLEGVKLAAQCIRGLSCATFFDEDAFVPCWDRAEERLHPSPAVRRFCAAWSTRWFECGSFYATERCETDWGLWSDAYLADMTECTKGTCEGLPSCQEALQAAR